MFIQVIQGSQHLRMYRNVLQECVTVSCRTYFLAVAVVSPAIPMSEIIIYVLGWQLVFCLSLISVSSLSSDSASICWEQEIRGQNKHSSTFSRRCYKSKIRFIQMHIIIKQHGMKYFHFKVACIWVEQLNETHEPNNSAYSPRNSFNLWISGSRPSVLLVIL